MSDPSSVGFQITSDPDRTTMGVPTGAAREREPGGAFRLLLVSDLDPQAVVQDWSDGERAWDVDVNTFADRMREHGPRLEVSVGVDGERQTMTWTADALDAFTPAGIASRVPTLAAVAAAQTVLTDARTGTGTLDDLRARLHETGITGADALAATLAARASSAPPPDDSSLDALLGLVSLDGQEAPASPAVSALIDAASQTTDLDRAAVARLADDLGTHLRDRLSALVAHPDVRRAEAAWRGLKMLVDRLDFRHGARLTVLAAPLDALAEAVHFQVLLPEYEHGADRTALAAVIVDHAVDATSAHLAALGDVAASAGSLQVPIVLSASPAFFGLSEPTDFSRLPPATALLQEPQYAAFRSVRKRGEAAQLALAVPPFVLRPAYGDEHPDRAHGVEGGERLWGGAAILVGAAMAQAHRDRGWPTASAGQAVGDLHVRKTRMGAMPLAAGFGDAVLDDLARAGILSFSGPLRSDRAVLGPPATAAVPADGSPDARARASWPAAVASALATHRAITIGAECAGMPPEQAIDEIGRRFQAFLRADEPLGEDVVTVQYLAEHDSPTSRTYGVRLRPPRHVLPHSVGIVFGVEVPNQAGQDAA